MKAHRTDGVSFAFGLIFLAISAWWLVAQILDLALPAVGWIVAGALILIGVLGLLGALRSGRHVPASPEKPVDAQAQPVDAQAQPTEAETFSAEAERYLTEAQTYAPTSGAGAPPSSAAPAPDPREDRG